MPGKRGLTGAGRLRPNYLTTALLFRELMDGPATAAELVEATGMHMRTVQGFIMALHRKNVVRIAGWERDRSGKQSIRVYEFGEAADATKVATRPRAPYVRLAERLRLAA